MKKILRHEYQDDCPDCGAKVGREHKNGCDVERCVLCGGQAISCGCVYKVNGMDTNTLQKKHPDIYKNGATEKMLERLAEEEEKYGGRFIWDGWWPGVKEANEFGWYSRWVDRETGKPIDFDMKRPGTWARCAATDPGAGADLNRLGREAVWSREQRRWTRPS
jgi:hypothetical protein